MIARTAPAVSRRAVLVGGGALAAAAVIGFHAAEPVKPLPAGLLSAGADALVLHGGGTAALAFMAELRRTTGADLTEQSVDMLTRKGFASLHPILDGAGDHAGGRTLVAFVGDAQAIVLETLLGARVVQRHRHAGHVLLTARL